VDSYNRLLEAWRQKFPNDSEAQRAVFPIAQQDPKVFAAPHFCDSLISDYPEESVLKSTLDSRLQTLLEKQVERYILRRKDIGVRNAAALIVGAWEKTLGPPVAEITGGLK
jgi:membrane carboxypeptidase/penicillin-binding protein PbpC